MEPSPAPKVTLVGWSTSTLDLTPLANANNNGPLEVIAIIWKQSKEVKPLDQIIKEVASMTTEELAKLMVAVLEGVPVVEAVSFNFVLENVSISWREQMVRHRVGTRPDPRVGADWEPNTLAVQVIPEQADMSAWSQSMRLLDLTDFADRRAYRTPETVLRMDHEGSPRIFNNETAVEEWHSDMVTIQELYKKWAGYGMPLEDARDLIPLGATSRLSWTLNLRTLQHIVGKRGCTILQLGLWGPVIIGMISELVKKVHPVFGTLVTPPCMKGDKYTGCIFPEDIRRRFEGMDGYLPVCPLYIGREEGEQAERIREEWHADGVFEREGATLSLPKFPNRERVIAEADRREAFWGRNPWTGERKS